jgi:hypothetical protein
MLSGKILQVHKSMRFCEKSCVSLKHIALCEKNIVLIQKALRFLRNLEKIQTIIDKKSVLLAHSIKKFYMFSPLLIILITQKGTSSGY